MSWLVVVTVVHILSFDGWGDTVNHCPVVMHCLVMIPFLQCRAGGGVCPDRTSTAGGSCREDNFNISGNIQNGVTCVTYSRRFDTGGLHVMAVYMSIADYNVLLYILGDTDCDSVLEMASLSRVFAIWALGPRGATAFQHFERSGGMNRHTPCRDTVTLVLDTSLNLRVNSTTQSCSGSSWSVHKSSQMRKLYCLSCQSHLCTWGENIYSWDWSLWRSPGIFRNHRYEMAKCYAETIHLLVLYE